MELKINDIDCSDDLLFPIRILNPILNTEVSKKDAFNLIKLPNNLITMEWYSIIRYHHVIGMILNCQLAKNNELIFEGCTKFNINFDDKSRYFIFMNNGLMNTEIHAAVCKKDTYKVMKLRMFKILKINK